LKHLGHIVDTYCAPDTSFIVVERIWKLYRDETARFLVSAIREGDDNIKAGRLNEKPIGSDSELEIYATPHGA
jgi:hypothetical protein